MVSIYERVHLPHILCFIKVAFEKIVTDELVLASGSLDKHVPKVREILLVCIGIWFESTRSDILSS